jgi:hypothetical protein
LSAPATVRAVDVPLVGIAFALLAGEGAGEGIEAEWLDGWRHTLRATGVEPRAALRLWVDHPARADVLLHAVAVTLGLSPAETLAAALAVEVELDAMAGRVLAWLQSPSGGARPTVGLLAPLAAALDGGTVAAQVAALVGGRAVEAGLLQIEDEARPLPERGVMVPTPTALALAGETSRWPGVEGALEDPPPLPPSLVARAARYAAACGAACAEGSVGLVIRSGHPREARAGAQLVARALDAEPAFVPLDPPDGLGPWLRLTGRVPVICGELAPGEQRALPPLHGYAGPVLVASGPDGAFTRAGDPVTSWRLPVPDAEERVALWRELTGESELAHHLGSGFRHGAARIQGLARAARFQAALGGDARVLPSHVAGAGRSGAAADLGSVAELIPDAIGDDAFVLPLQLRADLEALLLRCTGRDALVASLGEAARTCHRPGVLALFYGPSGTGKTLAAAWLATRLGLPLYRVDLASVTSKYIGETEKNLAQLFARAENAEVVLLFDEADALFGKRTDVKDSNDRYANAQTNYLLQRIESLEGIAIQTSNGRARFDSAFSRRLDAVIEFPSPAPEERRAIWLAHLGDGHDVGAAELNRLAAGCDLAGGHIRNAVLAAAALARRRSGPIAFGDLAQGVVAEYRKLGRQAPSGLAVPR